MVALALSFDSSGFPALLIILSLLYLLVYVPLKLITKVIAHAKAKAERMRLLKQGTIIAEYDPPANLGPAELGFLFASKLTPAAVFGTIVSLDQRGLVNLTDTGGHWVIGEVKTDAQLTDPYEQSILGYLGTHSGQVVDQSMLRKMVRLSGIVINTELRQQGYLISLIEQIKGSFLRIGLVTLFLMLLFPILALHPTSSSGILEAIFFLVFLSPVYVGIAVLLYATYQKITGERWRGTPKLKQIWPDIEGYREYIAMVELQELQFESSSPEIVKNKSLPYAIALGLNTNWQKKL